MSGNSKSENVYEEMDFSHVSGSANTVAQFLFQLSRPENLKAKKVDLELRRLQKMKERKRLRVQGLKQKQMVEKYAMQMKTTESKLNLVDQEINELDREILIARDAENE